MTDLIKFLRTSTSSAFNKTAADCIEELMKELNVSRMASVVMDNTVKELTLQLLAVHGQAANALDKAVVAEAKLAKAVEVLREIEADCDADYPPSHGAIKHAIRTTLAELEGK